MIIATFSASLLFFDGGVEDDPMGFKGVEGAIIISKFFILAGVTLCRGHLADARGKRTVQTWRNKADANQVKDGPPQVNVYNHAQGSACRADRSGSEGVVGEAAQSTHGLSKKV